MDKDLIRQFKLEEACRRINQINEYVFYEGNRDSLITDDDSQEQEPEQQNGMDLGNQQGQPEQQNPETQQQAPQTDGPDMDGGGMPQMPDAQDSEQPDGGQMPDQQDFDFGGPDDEGMEGGPEQMQPGDEVIDVDDLTNAQEEMEQTQQAQTQQLDGVDRKLSTLMQVVDKFSKALEANDAKIADLKAEFEKRNPTEEEKIGIRRDVSGPYDQNPKDVFNGLNSRIERNNMVYPEKETTYEITYDDIKDDAGIDKTFSDYPKDLVSYFK